MVSKLNFNYVPLSQTLSNVAVAGDVTANTNAQIVGLSIALGG